MKKFKNIPGIVLVIFLIGISPVKLIADDNNYRSKLYNSFVSGDMQTWEQVLKKMEQDYSQTQSTGLLYNIAFAQYG